MRVNVLKTQMITSILKTHHMYSTLKQRGNSRFHVVLTYNTRSGFVGNTCLLISKIRLYLLKSLSENLDLKIVALT